MSDTDLHELTYDHLHWLCACPTPVTSLEALIERLESHYDFQCEGGPLRLCVEWQALKAAFTTERTRREQAEQEKAEAEREAAIRAALRDDVPARHPEDRTRR